MWFVKFRNKRELSAGLHFRTHFLFMKCGFLNFTFFTFYVRFTFYVLEFIRAIKPSCLAFEMFKTCLLILSRCSARAGQSFVNERQKLLNFISLTKGISLFWKKRLKTLTKKLKSVNFVFSFINFVIKIAWLFLN